MAKSGKRARGLSRARAGRGGRRYKAAAVGHKHRKGCKKAGQGM